MNIVEIRGLDFNYHNGKVNIPVFKSFNMAIRAGEFVAIKGPSGSGKSTLLYLITGLLKFSRGTIFLDGKNISRLKDLDLSVLRNVRVGFIFQQFHLLAKSTVLDNILLPTLYPIEEKKAKGNRREAAEKLALELGIGDRLSHWPNQLSGGQQQRVAIARALINDPEIILADEPTGNLDSKSTEQMMNILKGLHAKGKTIVLITHDDEVARAASRILTFKDGKIIGEEGGDKRQGNFRDHQPPLASGQMTIRKTNWLAQGPKLFPVSLANIFRNKVRSLLTMLGIVVGVAAVCSMITLGTFTKDKILDSYASLGVNTFLFRGWPNWNLKATDLFSIKFQSFNWEKELLPLRDIFPDIQLISPSMTSWNSTVTFAGQAIDREPKVVGISEDGLHLLGRELIAGRNFSSYHIERKDFVCIIGFDIGKRLFSNMSPLGQIIHISQDESSFACQVIGVLATKTSNKDLERPNLQVYIPFSLFQVVSDSWWQAQIRSAIIQVRPGSDLEKVGKAIQGLFEQKYGKSGRFQVNSDSILIAQMEKFLNLFLILLVAIALVSLVVGGMGIANMMLVTVSERFKEIGIRKSLGATNLSIRNQFLLESVFLCSIAGVMGVVLGIVVYQGAIYGASQLIPKLQFQWVLNPIAIGLSLLSIVAVGVLSGLVPAIKAEKLQVVDALRSE